MSINVDSGLRQMSINQKSGRQNIDSGLWTLVGVRVSAATGQAGLLAICGDSGNGEQDQAF